MKNQPFPSNVEIDLTFYRSNRQRIDLDNLVKQVLDSANKIAWEDDAQVTTITARLHYDPANPRTHVIVREDPGSSMLRGEVAKVRASCETCGISFTYTAYPSVPPQRHCSGRCAARAICPECESPFEKRTNGQRYCSKECTRKFHQRNTAERQKVRREARRRKRPPKYVIDIAA